MNCRPGDLAVIVGSGHPRNIGALVDVLAWHAGDGEWECKALHSIWGFQGRANARQYQAGHIVFIEDRDLRPIRPGDISDEEVRDLYAPSDAGVTA